MNDERLKATSTVASVHRTHTLKHTLHCIGKNEACLNMRRWTAQLFIEPFFPFNDLRPLPFDTLTNPRPSSVPNDPVCLSRFLSTTFIRRHSFDVPANGTMAHKFHFLILGNWPHWQRNYEKCARRKRKTESQLPMLPVCPMHVCVS